MCSSECSQHWPSARGSAPRICAVYWVRCRSIFVLYFMLCLASQPEPVESHKLRCGTELMSDLAFVCGDRGFYIGTATRFRTRHRLREPGIVNQCCFKGCSLNYMETFCAKPNKIWQYITPTSPQEVTEQQFQTVFHRRLEKHLETANSAERQTHVGKNVRQDKDPSLHSTEHLTSSPPAVSRNPLSMITQF